MNNGFADQVACELNLMNFCSKIWNLQVLMLQIWLQKIFNVNLQSIFKKNI